LPVLYIFGNQDFHIYIWSRLRGNGAHTPDPDAEESEETTPGDAVSVVTGGLSALSAALLRAGVAHVDLVFSPYSPVAHCIR